MPDIRTLFSGIMLSTTCPSIASMKNLSAEALQHVAAYFQALSEPTRLQIMNLLREGELNVGEIAEACGCSSANVSRHLTLLMRHGLVDREARGTTVYYRIADPSVYALCDLVCDSIATHMTKKASEQKAFVKAGRKTAATTR